MTKRFVQVALGGALGLVVLLRLAASLSTLPVASLKAASGPEPSLLVVFQPGDCTTYRDLVNRWNALHREGVIHVVGAPIHYPGGAKERERALKRSGVDFPVRFDLARRAERLILRLGYGQTPVALLLDIHGRLRLAVPPHGSPIIRRDLAGLVADYARLLDPRKPEGKELP